MCWRSPALLWMRVARKPRPMWNSTQAMGGWGGGGGAAAGRTPGVGPPAVAWGNIGIQRGEPVEGKKKPRRLRRILCIRMAPGEWRLALRGACPYPRNNTSDLCFRQLAGVTTRLLDLDQDAGVWISRYDGRPPVASTQCGGVRRELEAAHRGGGGAGPRPAGGEELHIGGPPRGGAGGR